MSGVPCVPFHDDDPSDGGSLDEDAALDALDVDDETSLEALLRAHAGVDVRAQDDVEIAADVANLRAIAETLRGEAQKAPQHKLLIIGLVAQTCAEQLAVRQGVLERRLREHARKQRGTTLRANARSAGDALMIAQAVSASARAWAVRDDRSPDVHDIFAQTPWRLEDFVYVPEPDPPEDGIIRVNPDPNVDYANPDYVRSLRGSGVSNISPLHPTCGGAQFAASAAERPSRIVGDAETGQPTRFKNNEVVSKKSGQTPVSRMGV